MRALVLLVALAGSASAAEVRFLELAGKRVELYVQRPAGRGPAPAVVLVHGHSRGRRGARELVRDGELAAMARRGWIAVAVSLPGYGRSAGAPDYCGPASQEVVRAAVRWTRALRGVDGRRVALVGTSRGAVTAAMAAAADPSLAALVLVTPIYDLGSTYERMRLLGERDAGARQVAKTIVAEAGADEAAFAARSPLAVATRIKVPTLILAGARDPRIDIDEAHRLAMTIASEARAVVFVDHEHEIPDDKRDEQMMPFLETALRR
jgi:dipeptidyl aminopeptidase/acylaminoacyl peptidase